MRRFLLATTGGATALATTLSMALTSPTAAAGTTGGGDKEPWVVRSAVMRTDAKEFRTLCGKQQEGSPEVRSFPLFGHDKSFTAVQDYQRQQPDGTVFWSGHDPKDSRRTISVSAVGACTKGPVTLSGVITSGFRQYAYEPAKRPGWYELNEIDSLKLPPSGQGVDTIDVPAKKPHKPHKPGLSIAATPENPAAIDVVVAYTPAALAEVGSVEGVRSRIAYGVNQVNSALANANVPVSLHVVNTYQTQPTGVVGENVNTLLSMISNSNNTVLGVDAAAQRRTYSADLVALLASVPAQNSSGASSLPIPAPSAMTSAAAFSVTSILSVTGWENLGHEIGHNFGMQHDRLTFSRQGSIPPEGTSNYGWVTPNGRHHTLMAYSSACPQACNVVNTYSNPQYFWGNQPLGNAENNNAARALQSADVLAAYRPSLVTNRRALTFAADPAAGGTLKVSQFGPYDPGTQVTVWATPNPGYRFDAWAVDGVELPDNLPPSYQITMNTDHTVTAFFTPLP
ncbi:reprolysin-like metallopeptidase [Streptomyces erythrochromogenes]|uniref:reprolysin-like metallopeptidase n=1 Tax=Streptomyces erythrochromogenes TaxID=285574 RepID=UPI0037D16C8D